MSWLIVSHEECQVLQYMHCIRASVMCCLLTSLLCQSYSHCDYQCLVCERGETKQLFAPLGVMHQIKKLADPDIPLGVSPPKSSDSTTSVKQQELNCSHPQPGPSSSACSLSVASSGGITAGSSSSMGSTTQLGVVSCNSSPNGSIVLGGLLAG